MAFEVNNERVICSRCGLAFTKRSGNFYACRASIYKGLGYLTICKECIEQMYSTYLSQCKNAKDAVRQMCRKIDIIWNENAYDTVSAKATAHTIMSQYIKYTNTLNYVGKSYDDTLLNEGTLWSFCDKPIPVQRKFEHDMLPSDVGQLNDQDEDVQDDISDDVKAFWGSGYSADVYRELEQRRASWVASLPSDAISDAGTDALIRQICSLELDINRARAAGRSVDKSVTALNALIGSITKMQKSQDTTDSSALETPLGVWLYRFENQRPLPEIDDSLKDVNGIRRYVFTWMGHLCKMLGLKNGYVKMYEEEIERLRVNKPEYDGDDDEAFFAEVMLDEPPGTEMSDTG